MDSFDDLLEVFELPESKQAKSGKGKKRKWREIEALKEKHRLKKELQELDLFREVNLDDLAI